MRFVLIQSLLVLENEQIQQEMLQTVRAINNDLQNMGRFNEDWAKWDETYSFMQNSNQAYINSNLSDFTFMAQRLNLIMYVDQKGRLVHAQWFDLDAGQPMGEQTALNQQILSSLNPLLGSSRSKSLQGLIVLDSRTMLITVNTITNSLQTQPPNGYLITGRIIGPGQLIEYSQLTGVSLRLAALPASASTTQSGLTMDSSIEAIKSVDSQISRSSDQVTATTVLQDINHRDRFSLIVEQNRSLYERGVYIIYFESAIMALGIIALGVFLFFLMKRQVLDRLIRLSREVAAVRDFGQTPAFHIEGQDELAELGGCLESMYEELNHAHERVQYLNTNDVLTGLHNRAYFENQLNALKSTPDQPIAMICADLDNLKLANDLIGHHYGDQLLQKFSRILEHASPPGAMVSRIGGDEFVIILHENHPEYLQELCNTIRQLVLAEDRRNPSISPFSASIGYAGNWHRKISPEDMVREADDAMMREKTGSGKHRNHLLNVLESALAPRDFVQDGHLIRMKNMAVRMAVALNLDEQSAHRLELLAEYHDLGKIGIDEYVLIKEGRLTKSEREQMLAHCEIGYHLAMATPELQTIAPLILKHHEWWNGSGNPGGFTGPDIPLESRIISILDAYDAMTHERPYHSARPTQEALDQLRDGAGLQFDPHLVDLFISLLDDSQKPSP